MSHWQYRVRYTNFNWDQGGNGNPWREVKDTGWPAIDIRDYSSLIFRRKPNVLLATLRRLRGSDV